MAMARAIRCGCRSRCGILGSTSCIECQRRRLCAESRWIHGRCCRIWIGQTTSGNGADRPDGGVLWNGHSHLVVLSAAKDDISLRSFAAMFLHCRPEPKAKDLHVLLSSVG